MTENNKQLYYIECEFDEDVSQTTYYQSPPRYRIENIPDIIYENITNKKLFLSPYNSIYKRTYFIHKKYRHNWFNSGVDVHIPVRYITSGKGYYFSKRNNINLYNPISKTKKKKFTFYSTDKKLIARLKMTC